MWGVSIVVCSKRCHVQMKATEKKQFVLNICRFDVTSANKQGIIIIIIILNQAHPVISNDLVYNQSCLLDVAHLATVVPSC